jgi:hypothetical protein
VGVLINQQAGSRFLPNPPNLFTIMSLLRTLETDTQVGTRCETLLKKTWIQQNGTMERAQEHLEVQSWNTIFTQALRRKQHQIMAPSTWFCANGSHPWHMVVGY